MATIRLRVCAAIFAIAHAHAYAAGVDSTARTGAGALPASVCPNLTATEPGAPVYTSIPPGYAKDPHSGECYSTSAPSNPVCPPGTGTIYDPVSHLCGKPPTVATFSMPSSATVGGSYTISWTTTGAATATLHCAGATAATYAVTPAAGGSGALPASAPGTTTCHVTATNAWGSLDSPSDSGTATCPAGTMPNGGACVPVGGGGGLYSCPTTLYVTAGRKAIPLADPSPADKLPNGHDYCLYSMVQGDRYAGVFDRVLGKAVDFYPTYAEVPTGLDNANSGFSWAGYTEISYSDAYWSQGAYCSNRPTQASTTPPYVGVKVENGMYPGTCWHNGAGTFNQMCLIDVASTTYLGQAMTAGGYIYSGHRFILAGGATFWGRRTDVFIDHLDGTISGHPYRWSPEVTYPYGATDGYPGSCQGMPNGPGVQGLFDIDLDPPPPVFQG